MSAESQARGLLSDALRALDGDQVEGLVRLLSDSQRDALRRQLHVQVQERYVRGGLARLVADRLHGLPAGRRGPVARILVSPVMDATIDHLGTDSSAPTRDQLASVLPEVRSEFGLPATRLMLASIVEQEMPAAPFAADLLGAPDLAYPESREVDGAPDRDFLAKPAGEVDEPGTPARESEDSETADAFPEELFTPLDIVLIGAAVSTYTGIDGALSREDLRRMVRELVRTSSARHRSYFHVGFVSALDVAIEGDDLLDEKRGINESRRQWLYFGRLNGFARIDDVQGLRREIQDHRADCLAVLAHPAMGRVVLRQSVEALLFDDPTLAAEALDSGSSAGALRPSAELDLVRKVIHKGRELLAAGSMSEAEALLGAALRRIDRLQADSDEDAHRLAMRVLYDP